MRIVYVLIVLIYIYYENMSRAVYIALSQPVAIHAKIPNQFEDNVPNVTVPCQLLNSDSTYSH